jgi:hypothetical protein
MAAILDGPNLPVRWPVSYPRPLVGRVREGRPRLRAEDEGPGRACPAVGGLRL